jgi:hypothetical protein
MLTGCSPYGGDGFAVVLQKVVSGEPIDVSAVEAISPILASVVALALQKDVTARFQSARELSYALKSATTPDMELPDVILRIQGEKAVSRQATGIVEPGAWQAFKHAYLSQVRPLLLSAIGPIADHVISNLDKTCSTEKEWSDALAVHFIAKPEGHAFRNIVAAMHQRISSNTPGSLRLAEVSPNAQPLALSPEFLNLAQNLLTSYIGPISGVVIRQSLFGVAAPQEFSDRLALQIQAGRERSQFQTRLRRLMIIHGLPMEEGR